MKKRIVSFLLALVMAVSLLPVSAFAVDGKLPDVAGTTLEEIIGSTYGGAAKVYLAKLPTGTSSISITVPDNTFIRTADNIGGCQVYAPETLLEKEAWYHSAESVAYHLVGSTPEEDGYDSFEEWLSDVPGYDSIEEMFNDLGVSSAEDYWKDTIGTSDSQTLTLSTNSIKIKKTGKTDFEKWFKNTQVAYDATVSFYVVELCTNTELLRSPGENIADGRADQVVLVQVGEGIRLNVEDLQTAINNAPTTGYYTVGDRWNGKTISENGFWADYQSTLAKAKAMLTAASSQEQVDTAAAALQAAIDNLIPTSRVNATALYEALNTKWCWLDADHMSSTAGDPVSADNCTYLSWQPYAKALTDGRVLLEQLYKDGNPTDENTDAKQGEVDKLAAAADAHKLVNKEAYAAAYDKYMAAKPEAEALLQQYDPAKLKESDYTADSWKTYTDAYDTLKSNVAYRVVGGTTEDYAMLSSFSQHMAALKYAYRQLTSATDVTVSFTYINNFSALYPGFGGTSLYANSSLPLAAGSANLLGAYNAANIELDTHDDTSLPGYYYANTGDTNPRFLVFINGSCAGLYIWSSRNSTLYPQHALSAVQLHNGDSVKMVRVAMPQFNKEDSSGLDSSKWNLLNASEEHYQSSVALIDMTAPGSAKVGDKAKFSATVTGANTTNLGSGKSAAGITLFISDPSETEALSQPIHKTAAATGADGSLQYVFTKPGWYTVAMFNVTPDDYTRVDIYGSTTIGEYYSLYGGDYALIHVTEADDTAALLKQYRAEKAAEAKAYFDNFHDYDFTAEGYAALKAQYETLTANLQKATDLTALMETYDADFASLKELGKAAIDHAAVIAGLRQNLSYLPDDLNDLNAN